MQKCGNLSLSVLIRFEDCNFDWQPSTNSEVTFNAMLLLF